MPKANYYGLILAGGRGTRFWPRSRRAHAKQVLNFFGDRSLIQQTVDRLAPVIPPERIWVLTNDHLRAEIIKQLPEVPRRQILAEPVPRNTAPAIGLAAEIMASLDPKAVMGVFPSDHVVTKPARYLRIVRPAFQEAERGSLVVLGIEPRWAETGYGYIEFPDGVTPGRAAAYEVASFREKPDAATAERFVGARRFCWNAGMFFWKASAILDALRMHLPKTATLLAGLPRFGTSKFGAGLKRTFPQCENISIDHAVLEKAKHIAGFAVDDIGWNDVGSFNAVYELMKRDSADNASNGEVIYLDARRNFVDAQGKLVALVGVEDLVVVDTPDALLVVDRKRAQEVGDLVKMLEKQKRDALL